MNSRSTASENARKENCLNMPSDLPLGYAVGINYFDKLSGFAVCINYLDMLPASTVRFTVGIYYLNMLSGFTVRIYCCDVLFDWLSDLLS